MKTALITGASAGIGAAFAKELAERKTDVILVARSQEKLEKLAEELQSQHHIKAHVIIQDLTQPGATKAIFEQVSQQGLTVDLLINNAGFGDYGAFAERKLEKQVQMIQLNVLALVELTHLFLTEMKKRRSGAIINVSSISAYQALPYCSVYSATKAFILHFTEALWAENKDSGVRILALCPGPTESNFFVEAEFPNTFGGAGQNYATAKEVAKETLLALQKDFSTIVTGGINNQIIVNLPRLLPRDTVISMVEKQFRPQNRI